MKEKAKSIKFSFADPPDIMIFDDWRVITHTTDTDDALEQIIDMITVGLQEEVVPSQFCIFPFEREGVNSNILCLSLTSKVADKIVV